MKWRYAMRMAVASSSRSRTTSCCPRTRTPLPARCSPVGAALKLGGPGGSPERGSRSRRRFRYTLANFVSRHSSQGSLPGADLSTNTGRDNATGPLPHSSPPHPEDAPGSPKSCRRGGDFHLAKNGDRKLAIDILEPLQDFRIGPDTDPTPGEVETEPQQRSYRCRNHLRLLPVHLQLQPLLNHGSHRVEHPVGGPSAPHEDTNIIGITDEPVTALPQLPVQVIEHDVMTR